MNTPAFEKFYSFASAYAATRDRVSREFKSMTEGEQTVVIQNYGKVWGQREEVISIIALQATQKPALAL